MTAFTIKQYTLTTYTVELDLPDDVQAHIDAGHQISTLDDQASTDLYEAFTSLFHTDNEVDYEVLETLIVDTDLPGHRPILPITI